MAKQRDGSLLNKAAVKRYILSYMALARPGQFTRVGEDVFPKVEAELRMYIGRMLHSLPSKGKTIRYS